MKSLATMLVTGLAFVLQSGFAGTWADGTTSTSGHCTGMTVTDYVSSDALSATNSSAWQNVTDAHLNFTTSATGCLIITFSGPVHSTAATIASNFLHVRTLLDGNNLCTLAHYNDRFLGAPDPAPLVAASTTRTCKNVAAGAHTLQVQFRNEDGLNTDTVFINSSVLTVTHN
jgi:hypothetical protein